MAKGLKTNIREVFKQTNEAEIKGGLAWYRDAHAVAAAHGSVYSLPAGVVAHVIAALSPNNSWSRNVYDVGELLRHELLAFAEPSPRFCTYPANVDKARLIVRSYQSGGEWREILRGRKVTNFAHNIEFPQNEDGNVTVDGHAYSIAHGRRYTSATIPSIGKAKYEQVSRAYRAVAKETGFRAHEVQAITWLCWKRLHGI